MTTIRKFAIAFTLIAVLAAAVPAFAQDNARTITFTEAEVNSTNFIDSTRRTNVEEVYIDFQPGQVVLTATITFRGNEPIQTSSTFAPYIENARLYWDAIAVDVTGVENYNEFIVERINEVIANSWQRYLRAELGMGNVTGVLITDNELTIAYEGFDLGEGVIVYDPAGASETTLTLNEATINETFRAIATPYRSVNDVYVDLQPGQVVVTAVITLNDGEPLITMTTLTPALEDGHLTWSVESVLVEGQTLSQDILDQVNAAISNAWRNYITRQAGRGTITAFELAEDLLTVTLDY